MTANTAALVQRLRDALEAAMGDLVEPRATWGLGAVNAASTAIAAADRWLAEQPVQAVAQPLTDAQIVSRAMEAGDLDDLCVLVDYDPDTGPVRQRWVPRGPVRRLVHAIVRANKPGATK